jgi:LysR family transcriptional regulator, glycine cleavage system transcriptional activator
VQWERWLATHAPGVSLSPRGMHFDRSFLAIAAAVDGLGICLESTHMAERELASGRLVMPFGPLAIRAIGHRIVWRAGAQPARVRAFLRWIAAEAARRTATL